MPADTRFAANTTVPVGKTEAEIKDLLRRNGATDIIMGDTDGRAFIQFSMRDRLVRFVLPLPAIGEKKFQFSPGGRKRLTAAGTMKVWEQACRSRWRALLLSIRAKLEACAIGITEFEREFLAQIVDPSTGRTIGEAIVPQIRQRYAENGPPVALIGFSDPQSGK